MSGLLQWNTLEITLPTKRVYKRPVGRSMEGRNDLRVQGGVLTFFVG